MMPFGPDTLMMDFPDIPFDPAMEPQVIEFKLDEDMIALGKSMATALNANIDEMLLDLL